MAYSLSKLLKPIQQHLDKILMVYLSLYEVLNNSILTYQA